jgi:hypothetical protein
VVEGSGEGEVDQDLFVDVDHEGAGVFEAPLDVGDGEGAGGLELVGGCVDLHGDVDLVGGAEEGEEAVDKDVGVAGGVEGAGEVGGGEGDGLEGGGFELVVGHAVVAGGVAALAAEGVDDDGAGGFAGGGVEGDLALLDVEGAVDGVDGVAEGEVDFAVGGVEGEDLLGVEEWGCGYEEEEGVAKEAGYAGSEAVEHGAGLPGDVHGCGCHHSRTLVGDFCWQSEP